MSGEADPNIHRILHDCKNLYEVLDLDRSANRDQIRKKYLFFANRVHPDKDQNRTVKKEATEAFQKVNEANFTLSNQQRRAQYDAQLNDVPIPENDITDTESELDDDEYSYPRQPPPDPEYVDDLEQKVRENLEANERSLKEDRKLAIASVLFIAALALYLKGTATKNLPEPEPEPMITQITKQADLFKECVADAKEACAILFVPSLSVCDEACRRDHIHELTLISRGEWFDKKKMGWLWSETGNQPNLEHALGGYIPYYKVVLFLVRFRQERFWRFVQGLYPYLHNQEAIGKKRFIKDVLKMKLKSGDRIDADFDGGLPKIITSKADQIVNIPN